jgi:hypothetical protein
MKKNLSKKSWKHTVAHTLITLSSLMCPGSAAGLFVEGWEGGRTGHGDGTRRSVIHQI